MASTLFAQQGRADLPAVPDDHPIWNDPLLDPVLVQLSADFMVQELNLSQEQGEQLRVIEEEINAAMRQVNGLDRQEQQLREKTLLVERTKRVAEVLNEYQLEHLDMIKHDQLRDRAAKLAVQREADAAQQKKAK